MNFCIYLAIALGILIAFFKTPKGRGIIGEFKVKCRIGKNKEGVRFVINDLRIRTEDGKTSQVDHVVIQQNGIFVIETKNYSGRIYGKENQQEWTQVLAYGKIKHKMYNPLKQNRTHIYRINQILKNAYPLTSAIVFVQGNTAHIHAPDVYSLRELKRLLKRPGTVLSPMEMQVAYDTLSAVKEESHLSTREHVSNIRKLQDNLDNNICPRCGKTLVLRQGKSGTFYGCSDYPKCKFTKR